MPWKRETHTYIINYYDYSYKILLLVLCSNKQLTNQYSRRSGSPLHTLSRLILSISTTFITWIYIYIIILFFFSQKLTYVYYYDDDQIYYNGIKKTKCSL